VHLESLSYYHGRESIAGSLTSTRRRATAIARTEVQRGLARRRCCADLYIASTRSIQSYALSRTVAAGCAHAIKRLSSHVEGVWYGTQLRVFIVDIETELGWKGKLRRKVPHHYAIAIPQSTHLNHFHYLIPHCIPLDRPHSGVENCLLSRY
jgi:hypothetical protein